MSSKTIADTMHTSSYIKYHPNSVLYSLAVTYFQHTFLIKQCVLGFYLRTYIYILRMHVNIRYFMCGTETPNAVMNVRIRDDITSESFVVLWDEVMDIFTITYNVTWYNDSGIIGMNTVNSPPYTVTGLTANTSYNVTVVAINTCCGAGPVSDVVMVMTNMRESTPAPPPSNLTTSSPSPSDTPGKIYSFYKYVQSVD